MISVLQLCIIFVFIIWVLSHRFVLSQKSLKLTFFFIYHHLITRFQPVFTFVRRRLKNLLGFYNLPNHPHLHSALVIFIERVIEWAICAPQPCFQPQMRLAGSPFMQKAKFPHYRALPIFLHSVISPIEASLHHGSLAQYQEISIRLPFFTI